MQITEAGRQHVGGLEFALIMKGLFREFLARGMDTEESRSRVVTMIAWAAVGRDITTSPTAKEFMELVRVVDSHGSEMNELVRACIEMAVLDERNETIN